MPFLKRYGATDMLDADQHLREQSEPVLPVAFGIRWRQRVLLRAYLPPTLPVAAPDTEVVSFSGHSGLWLGPGQIVPTPWPPSGPSQRADR